MSSFGYSGFSAALLNPERPVPLAVRTGDGEPVEKRFAVYRNNVIVGLVDALCERFPATRRVVGDDFFRGMARVFVRGNPPRSPLMMEYGEEFPSFIAGFPEAGELNYLADLARLEAARTRAFHAADALALDAVALSSIDQSKLSDLRFAQHSACEIVCSPHPIVTIWAMNSGERDLAPIEDWRGEDALVTRPGFEVLVRELPAGGSTFLRALFAGTSLSVAADAAQTDCAEFDLIANLSAMIASGAVTRDFISE